jgi:hypothetical protein
MQAGKTNDVHTNKAAGMCVFCAEKMGMLSKKLRNKKVT